MSVYGALYYNQEKVDKGKARTLGWNRIMERPDGTAGIPECMRSFEAYLAANRRTEKPVIHLSFNPHPDDRLSDGQLEAIGREYMEFDEAINNNKKSAREYFDEVLSDYITRQVTRVETKSGQSLTYLSTSYKYFGYFNCMIERKSKDETVIILHKNNDLKQPILAKELEIITNRIVRVFNDMGATFTLFDEAVEIPLLKADNWNRFLTLNDADVCLTRFKDTPMLCLWIKLKQPILQNKN